MQETGVLSLIIHSNIIYRHERQLSNLSTNELYDSSTLRANRDREKAVDVIEEEPSITSSSSGDYNNISYSCHPYIPIVNDCEIII